MINYHTRLFSFFSADVIILTKTSDPITFLFVLIARMLGKKVVYDTTDDYFAKNLPKSTYSFFQKIVQGYMVSAARLISRFSNLLQVDTRLEKIAKKFNKNVVGYYNNIDLSKYTKKTDYSISKSVKIGWVGNARGPHFYNLLMLLPVFKELVKDKASKIKFVFIGAVSSDKLYNKFKEIEGLEVEFITDINWEDTKGLTRSMSNFDIAVAPLEDNLNNRGHAMFKVLEYLAVGLPVVISLVGDNKNYIKHSVNGFLAKNEEEWIKHLKELIKDKKMRERVGKNARKDVEENYSSEQESKKFVEQIESL
jgi:glycosyltransferase involved in cell wall biosynthesis